MKFRLLFSSLLVAGLAILGSVGANAQTLGRQATTLTGGDDAFISANSTSNYTFVVGCGDVENIGIQLKYRSVANATNKPVVSVYESLDSTTWETTAKWSLSATAANGTNYICWNTNLFVPSALSLKLSIQWPDTNGSLSNITAIFRTKAPKKQTIPATR